MASIQTVVRANDDNIRETIENLRVATENLDQLTDQVKQRPWSLVRIRQPKDRKGASITSFTSSRSRPWALAAHQRIYVLKEVAVVSELRRHPIPFPQEHADPSECA